MTKLFFMTGETSGDKHGAHIAKALLQIDPSIQLEGVVGPHMKQAGVKEFLSIDPLQVMGFSDVLWSLPRLRKLFYAILQRILTQQPKAVVMLDYPDFNMRLAKALRKKGYRGKLIQYVCPSIWAWREKRKVLLEENLDLLLCILPFEERLFKDSPLRAVYVGNPICEEIEKSPTEKKEKFIALFPGSRLGEVKRNLPIMLTAVRQMQREDPSLSFGLSIASPSLHPLVEEMVQDTPITFFPPGDSQSLMQQCHTAIATCGTITLELGLHQKPTVVVYRLSLLNYWIARHLFHLNLSHYNLVNIICEAPVFPELIHREATAEALASEAMRFLTNKELYASCVEQCQRLQTILTKKNPSQEAAREIHRTLYEEMAPA